ncbi:MAG TPA: M28 family peptidase [Bacteroidota bacterium]|nr:M28 family peptidase [Bacteroidota bacterium]
MTRQISTLILLLFLGGCSTALKEPAGNPDITADELRVHIKYFASPELRGRRAGEEGNVQAARYIAGKFAEYGLTPLGENNSYFQPFTFVAATSMGKHNSLTLKAGGTSTSLRLDTDFRPIGFTDSVSFTAPLVFAGYGISANTDSLKYDDYAGIDVKKKIVLVLRYSPEGSGAGRFSKYQSIMEKAMIAKDHGAAGIVYLTNPSSEEGGTLVPFEYPVNHPIGIAAVTLRWEAFDQLLSRLGRNLADVRSSIRTSQTPHSFPVEGAEATIEAGTEKVTATTSNIVGMLEGTDPVLKHQAVAIGAHMDHLGMGGQGSLLPDTVAIHPGADDNASGSAALLELAQYFSAHRSELKRTLLFLSFTGEEEGLYGSDYYVKHPLYPLDSTVTMVNMDMVGRLKDSILVIEGMGSSPGWEQLVRSENRDSLFHLKLKPDGIGPSDHSSFYQKDIPVLFFFTNLHGDYHRPSDTWDKINYAGEEAVAKYIARIVTDIDVAPMRPAFTKAASTPMQGGDRGEVRVSLGVVPDMAEDVTGVKITGTRPNSAAEKAGLKGGDIIVKFGGDVVSNIYDFTHDLGKYKPGDEVEIVVKRNGAEVTLKAKLEGRRQ